jgi:uncharacterized damage-inducible protein DinB
MENVEDLIASCKASAVQGMEYFLRNFSFVPDDKLMWTPTPTSKSALQIAAHTAVCTGNFARMMTDRKLPTGDEIPTFVAQMQTAEVTITSRAEMERIFRQNTEAVLAALDTLTPEAIETPLENGNGGTMSMTALMNLSGWHATLHAGQIDYLQTCWGDQEIYVG